MMKNCILTLVFVFIYGISAAQIKNLNSDLGEKALAKGNYEDAAKYFEKALMGDSLLLGEDVLYEGVIAYAHQIYPIAYKRFTELLRIYDEDIDAYYLRGLTCYDFGKKYNDFLKMEMAAKDMEKVLALKADYKDAASLKPKMESLYKELYKTRDIVDEPDPNRFVFAQEQATPLNMDDVKRATGYPLIAREAGIEGAVMMRILVDSKGRYVKHYVAKAAHPLLTKEVEIALPFLVFTPAIQSGKPIPFWVNIPYNFKLQ